MKQWTNGRLQVLALALSAVTWLGSAQAGTTPERRCQQAKCKAQGKLKRCLMTNAAGLIVRKADKSAACWGKFASKLAKADATADSAGTSCRFLDNGDGTVSDLDTGLVWEKKTHLDGFALFDDVHDTDNYYAWSIDDSDPWAPTGNVFSEFLEQLNNGVSANGTATTGCFAKHCDWRLPTIEELAAIVDLREGYCSGGDGACIDPALGPTADGHYRSATTVDGTEGREVWEVYFHDGRVLHGDKPSNSYVRAVRGGL